jgi:GNAT superfamily N-acetyltransferase
MDGDPNHQLVVAEIEGHVIGTLHLTFLPSLSFRGGTRAQIESVRVDQGFRNQGIGEALVQWAIEQARQAKCRMVQLTTHASRQDAHRFYSRLGFSASHVGMKIDLNQASEQDAQANMEADP